MSKPEAASVIEIVGEGKTDLGEGGDRPEAPSTGVVPILVHRLCHHPESMRVRRKPLPSLQGKCLSRKPPKGAPGT